MKITVEVNVREDAAPQDVLEWLARGRMIDAGPQIAQAYAIGEIDGPASIAQAYAIGEISRTLVGTEEQVDRIANAGDENAGSVDENAGSVDENAGSVDANAPPGVKAAGSKRGPRAGRAASKTAEELAAALAAPAQPTPPPGVVQEPVPQPSMALPPGVTAPTQAAQPAPPGVNAAPAAADPAVSMPKADGNPTLDANGHIRLEDFRAEVMQVQNEAKARGKSAAFPFNVARAERWPDGSEKTFATMQIDLVPPEFRRTLLDHCMLVLNS